VKKPFAGAQTVRWRWRYWPLKLRELPSCASAAGFVLAKVQGVKFRAPSRGQD